MFEAYSIGVTLKLTNLVSPQMVLLAKEFERLDLLVLKLNTTLGKTGVESIALKNLAKNTEASSLALEKASRNAAALERHIAAIKATGGLPGAPLIIPNGGRMGGGGSGGGHRGNGTHGGNIHMGPGGIGIGTVGMAAGSAFVPLAVTAGMLYGGHALYESAKDLNTEMTKFKLFGMGDKLNAEAFKFVEGMKVYGTSRNENMKNFREAQGVFRESGLSGSAALEGAKLAAPILAKIGFLTESLGDESKAKHRTSSMDMMRYVESSGGLKSPEAFNKLAEFGWKMIQSSGGNVDWSQLRQLKARSGAAGFHLTEDALARLEPVMGELKGSTTGFGLRTSFNRLTGAIKLPNQVAHLLVDNGIWDKSKIEWNANGGIKRMKGNPLGKEATELLGSNPELFYEQKISSMYKRLKIEGSELSRMNTMIYGSTGGMNATMFENQFKTIHDSISSLAKMKGLDAATGDAKKSLSGQEIEFISAWTDFKTAFGTQMLPVFTGILKGGAWLIRAATEFNGKFTSFSQLGEGLGLPSPGSHPMANASIQEPAKGSTAWYAWRQRQEMETVRPGGNKPIQVTTKTYLDKREIAKSVTEVQTREMSRPQTGPRTSDPRMAPTPVGAQGSW